jgi:hypothetical protein
MRPTLAVLCLVVVFGCTCKTTPVAGEVSTGAERGPKAGTEPRSPERADKTVRPPSSAGKFYPAEAAQLDSEVRKYVDLVWMFRAPAHVCKVVLSARLGIDCGRPIAPVISLSDEEKREVLRAADSLGLTAPRPPGSSAVRR